MSRRPTIGDVAVRAGVSPSAISRWLNGRIDLPEPTRTRIRDAVDHLNYQPHAQARRLSSGKAEVIGIVVPDIAWVAVAAGYDVVIWSTRNSVERELACFDRLAAGYADGLIIITNHEDDGRLASRIRPVRGRVVIVDENVPDTDAPKFFVENEKGGYAATSHLLDHGHRRIAHVGGPKGVMSAIERASGWRRALTERGYAPGAGWHIASEYEVEPARADAQVIFELDPTPTAVFAGSDAIALGVMNAARDRGVSIPKDLSLVSFDGMTINELLGPPLSSIEQPIVALGRLGAECLLSMIECKGTNQTNHKIQRLPVKVVARGSVATLAESRPLACPHIADRSQEIARDARRTRR